MLTVILIILAALYLLMVCGLMALGFFFRAAEQKEGQKSLSTFQLIIRCLAFPFWYPYVIIKDWIFYNL